MSNTILAIDTSMNCCSVAIYKKKRIYSLSEKSEKKHTSKILTMIYKLFLQTKITFKDLNYIAFSKGPGNFTSLRIAASIAQSLSISLQIPIISISTLLIMAEKAWRKYKKRKIIVVIKAKTTHVYWANYYKNKKSIWIGKQTESLLENTSIKEKINNLKEKWSLVSNIFEQNKYKNYSNIDLVKIFLSNAQDIIPLVLLQIKTKRAFCTQENSINYLYDNFI